MSERKSITRVRDVMHSRFCHVDGLATVDQALKMLYEEDALALLVDKRDADDEYGIVLLSDIAKKVLAANRPPERTNVYEIMSKPALGVRPDMQVRYCARLFNAFGLTLAPVIDAAEEVLGVVSYEDLVLRGLARR
ncbi:MAG: CBS domain-containing protein [Gammaproteobacteria bacterium]|jgi:CBS-domain-containing membrane protein|nr:CBS domain-containing protein [Gammaproteobacteria bacterium]